MEENNMKQLTLPIGSNPDAKLFCYLQDSNPLMGKAPAIILCPGGAYVGLSYGEGEPLAMAFFAAGYNAFVLHYSVGLKCLWPQPLVEAGTAIKLIRDHADEWGVDANAITIAGFSAGGHVAATAGSMWNLPEIQEAIGASGTENRPNAMLLCYPCINIDMPAAENGELTLKKVSAAEYVGPHTPPAFVVHTYEDAMVSMEQSLQMVTAMSKADVPVEYHVFTAGMHGAPSQLIATPTKLGIVPGFYDWFDRFRDWLKDRFDYPRAPEFSFGGTESDDGEPLPFTVRTHEDTLECLVVRDMMSFGPPSESVGVSATTKLRDLVDHPEAMEILYNYVPQLKEYKLNELTLNLSLTNLLLWSGYNQANLFMQTPGDPEVAECISALNEVLQDK
jgi:acetyl esterase/lipase